MTPYRYKSFKDDMLQATDHFVKNTDYILKTLADSYIELANDKYIITFAIDGVTLVPSIEEINLKKQRSIYDLFAAEKILDRYPLDAEDKFTYEQWNKILVEKILAIFMTNLRHVR